MTKKKSQIDKAVDALENEIAVLQLAIKKLRDQQAKAPTRRPRGPSFPPNVVVREGEVPQRRAPAAVEKVGA